MIVRGPNRYDQDESFGRFVREILPSLTFEEADTFYKVVMTPDEDDTPEKRQIRRNKIAYLGCCDRFFLFVHLLKRIDGNNLWVFDRCREVGADPDGYIDLWARFHYKAVQINEKIHTLSGVKRHGDLIPGDFVFGPDGYPTRVISRTPTFFDADCYRVTFDKGYQVVVSGDHLWTVDVQSRKRLVDGKREGRKTVTVNTRELLALVASANMLSTKTSPMMRICEPLQFPPQELLVGPYTLGAWLGDGDSGSSTICGEDQGVFDRIATEHKIGENRSKRGNGFQVRTIFGLTGAAKELGIKGKGNKRIPEVYLKASFEQRVALLQGLMDTDGHCDTRGTATFVNVNEKLARDVLCLCAGLGLKPGIRQHVGVYKNEPYPFFHVSFQVHTDRFPVFGLERKQRHSTGGEKRRSTYHRIVDVTPVPSEPCSCIQVARQDGQYLIGEQCIPTHNSSIITFAGIIQEILIDQELTVSIFSHTKDIAQAFLDQIKTELENNDVLKYIYSDVLFQDPAKESLKWSKADGIIIRRKSNPKEATVEAHGLIDGQPISRHYGLMVYDDIITAKAVTSPEQIKKTTISWENSDNLAKAESNRKWTAGTRWSFGDTYGIIIERKSLKPRIYPATDNGKLNGNPVFLSDKRWAEIKATQKSTVSAQMLLNPIAGNEAMFEVEWFRGYECVPAVMNVYILCDPSKGRSKDSDRTAIAVIGVDPASNKYLLDGVRHRMRLSERYQFLKNLYKKWTDHPGVQMVKVGYEIYGQQADDEVIEEYQQRDGIYFELHELNYPRQGPHSKNSRVERLEPDMKSGRFQIPSIVWHPDAGGQSGSCQWVVWTDKHAEISAERGMKMAYTVGQVVYNPLRGLTKQQRYMHQTGQLSRIVQPIRRRAEDGEIYDLTRAFIEEARFFPFAPHDDLVDVISRVYDMDVQPPVSYEASATMPMTEDDIGHLAEDGSGGHYDA